MNNCVYPSNIVRMLSISAQTEILVLWNNDSAINTAILVVAEACGSVNKNVEFLNEDIG